MAEQKIRNPDLRDVLHQAMAATSAGLRVCAPGKITKVNRLLKVVDVKLSVREFDQEGNLLSMPTLKSIPLLNVGNTRIYTEFPARNGDAVLCIFGDIDLDSWKGVKGLKETDASSDRRHNLTDAVALPIGWGQGGVAVEVLSVIKEFLEIQAGWESTNCVVGSPVAPLPDIVLKLNALVLKLTLAGVE